MGQFPELMGLLTRVNALGILASAEFAQPALRLKAVLESRGCAVAAAVEAFPAEQPQTSHVQAVLVLGDAPGDPDAFKQDGELGLASSLAFAAIAAGAPVKAMNGKSGKEDVSSLIQDLKELPILDPHEARQRWAQAEAAAAADDEEGLEGALESWPELMTHRDSSGSTLLHHAASTGADRATSLLLERGADADLRNKEQATAGDIAFRAGKQTVFESLVMHRLRREQQAEVPEPPQKRQKGADRKDLAPDHYLSLGPSLCGNQQLRYEEGRLLDADSKAVMMGWEAPLMKHHAELLLPEQKLRICNVGFGLGLVDGYLAEREPSEHHIIEAHRDVLAEMRRRGWHERKGVVVHEGRWQDIVTQLPGGSLDAIFFDTWSETYEDLRQFQDEVTRLLAPGGRFSFFNGMAPYSITEHATFCRLAQEDLVAMGLPCDICKIELGELGNETWQGVKERYWQFDSYYLPLARKPPQSSQAKDSDCLEGVKGSQWRCWPEFPVRVLDRLGPTLPRAAFGLD